VQTIRIENRNALTWDDDRRAAAFVTAKDPTVLKLAKSVSAITKERDFRGVDKNLLAGLAVHEALDVYGISYVIDPTTPYVELSKAESTVDFLQFPKQTLEYMAGDCDDLSILYAALLESIGVETAFVTTPGHIFVAFALSMGAGDARKQFLYPDELIIQGGKAWVPVEITARNQGFLKAWQTGAKEWRENAAQSLAKLYPVHEAWTIYEPVGLPGTATIDAPNRERCLTAYVAQVERFVERELAPRISQVRAEIDRTQGSPTAVNKLGILYAQYGLDDKALEQFKKILERSEHVPALLNVGNVYFLKGQLSEAQTYYKRAQAVAPDNPTVLLGIARVDHELENYGTARQAYEKLKTLAPELAERFSYLALRGEEAGRAADVSGVKGIVVWNDE
jgi:tetratricopeptide (TPR) repeat protein